MSWKPDTSKIEDLLRSNAQCKMVRKGTGWVEFDSCPFCQGGEHRDKKTFAVNLTDGNFICKRGNCAQAGSLWALCEFWNVQPKDYHVQTSEKFAKTAPKTRARDLNDAPQSYVEPKTKVDQAEGAVREYLHGRGFTDETIKACRVGESDGKVVFPYHDNGKTVFVKFRRPRATVEGEQKAWAEKGGKRVLWGLDQCDPSAGPLVITFGEYDRMTVYQAGVANSVSVPSGDDDMGWIDLCWDELQRYDEFVLWNDNDKSGHRTLDVIAPRLGRAKIRTVKSQFKDANEMLLSRLKIETLDQANAEIFELVSRADWYPFDGLIRVSDIGERPYLSEGLASGLKPLDKITGGARPGEVTVHTGDNSAGKTSGLLLFAASAVENNEPVCVWSGELDRYTFRDWAHLHMAGREHSVERVSKLGRAWFEPTAQAKVLIRQWHKNLFFLYDRTTHYGDNNVFEAFEVAFQRHGCRTFILDNLMALLYGVKDGEKNGAQTEIIARAKGFAMSLGAHIHIVAHSNKTVDSSRIPTKHGVSGAKEIANAADNIFAWWRVPEDQRRGEFEHTDGLLCVLKNRAHGDESPIRLQYDRDVRRFRAQDEEYFPLEYGWTKLLLSEVAR